MSRLGIDRLLADEDPAFAGAVAAVVRGEAIRLRQLLGAHPELVTSRAAAAHRCTLLHYTASNGIEDELQLSAEGVYQRIRQAPSGERPALRACAIETARSLIDAGAEVDATCETYGGGSLQTTLNLLVSSGHPALAGVQPDLVRLLCGSGARVDGVGDDGSPLGTALAFGNPAAAEAVAECGARVDNIVFAAGLGDMERLRGYFDRNGRLLATGRCWFQWFKVSETAEVAAEQALVFASLCGRADAVAFLLDRGVDIDAQPPGSHMTATALHATAASGQPAIAKFLVERNADRGIRDRTHHKTPLDWAKFCNQADVAAVLSEA